jgi:hypothetical protein
MTFAGTNYIAIVIAAVVAWLAGAAWYMSLGRIWASALGLTPAEMEARRKEPGAFLPFIYVFVAELVMAWVLAGLLGHLGSGQVTLVNGIVSGAFCWVGFVVTVMVVNNSFQHRDARLLLVDGGYWLLTLLLMGAIIGWMGV